MTKQRFVEISQIELACRLAEAFSGLQRPEGMTASEALGPHMLTPEQRRPYILAADAAIAYLMECVKASGDEAKIKYQDHAGGRA